MTFNKVGCDFLNQVASELSRRHSNHKPQCFDFLIEYKVNDGTC